MRGSIRYKQLTTEWSGPYRIVYRKLSPQTIFNIEVDISRDCLLFIRQNMAFKSVFNKHLLPIKMITEGQMITRQYTEHHIHSVYYCFLSNTLITLTDHIKGFQCYKNGYLIKYITNRKICKFYQIMALKWKKSFSLSVSNITQKWKMLIKICWTYWSLRSSSHSHLK